MGVECVGTKVDLIGQPGPFPVEGLFASQKVSFLILFVPIPVVVVSEKSKMDIVLKIEQMNPPSGELYYAGG